MSLSKSRSRGWCFMLNNYTQDEIQFLSAFGSNDSLCVYLVFGKEVSESGTSHLQGYVYFKTLKSFKQAKTFLGERSHVEVQRGTSLQASDYCKKDGDFTEFGTCPSQGKRTDLEAVAKIIVDGGSVNDVAMQYPTTFIKYSRGIRELKLEVTRPYTRPDICGVWLVGEPGSGKSHYAQTQYPDSYKKAQNKWFDGYGGEKQIVLEDLDTGTLSHHLKIWADRWPCTGETKGGTVHLMHDVFVVTSNYQIEDLVPKKRVGNQEHDDDSMISALSRRFIVKSFRKLFVPPLVGEAGPGYWASCMTDENNVEHILGILHNEN